MAGRKSFEPDVAVDAATAVFWDKGYGATSTEDLVAGTGLGRGSLYNAFTSKHALFQRVLRRYGDRKLDHQGTTLEGSAPVRERVRAVLMEVVDEESGDDRAHRGCLAVNTALELAGADPDSSREVDRIVRAMRDALRVSLDRGRRDGEIAADRDTDALAVSILTTMYGLRVLGRTVDRRTLVGVVDAAIAAI